MDESEFLFIDHVARTVWLSCYASFVEKLPAAREGVPQAVLDHLAISRDDLKWYDEDTLEAHEEEMYLYFDSFGPPPNLCGVDYDDIAPKTPPIVRAIAKDMLEDLETNRRGESAAEAIINCVATEIIKYGMDPKYAFERAAHCTAMEALGTGVGWADSFQSDPELVYGGIANLESLQAFLVLGKDGAAEWEIE